MQCAQVGSKEEKRKSHIWAFLSDKHHLPVVLIMWTRCVFPISTHLISCLTKMFGTRSVSFSKQKSLSTVSCEGAETINQLP